jgi:FHA domain
LLAEALANVFFINFTEMNAIKYYTIGSELQNDLPITGADCASFHLLLMRNASGQVLVSNRLPQNGYAINGQQYLHLMALQAGDELSIGGQKINWMNKRGCVSNWFSFTLPLHLCFFYWHFLFNTQKKYPSYIRNQK